MRPIDADALMKEFAEYVRASNISDFAKCPTWNDAVSLLGSAPTVEERKTGRWKRTYLDHEAMGERPSILYCSECNQCIAYPVNFCPNCGSDMRGEEHEE